MIPKLRRATAENRTFEERPAEEGRYPRELRKERQQWIDHLDKSHDPTTQLKFTKLMALLKGKPTENHSCGCSISGARVILSIIQVRNITTGWTKACFFNQRKTNKVPSLMGLTAPKASWPPPMAFAFIDYWRLLGCLLAGGWIDPLTAEAERATRTCSNIIGGWHGQDLQLNNLFVIDGSTRIFI